MKSSKDFERLAQGFWQRSREHFDSYEAWVAHTVRSMTDAERTGALRFIEEAWPIASEDDWQDAWRRACSDYWFKPITPFIVYLRDELRGQCR